MEVRKREGFQKEGVTPVGGGKTKKATQKVWKVTLARPYVFLKEKGQIQTENVMYQQNRISEVHTIQIQSPPAFSHFIFAFSGFLLPRRLKEEGDMFVLQQQHFLSCLLPAKVDRRRHLDFAKKCE